METAACADRPRRFRRRCHERAMQRYAGCLGNGGRPRWDELPPWTRADELED
jgi:hypothetical protein